MNKTNRRNFNLSLLAGGGMLLLPSSALALTINNKLNKIITIIDKMEGIPHCWAPYFNAYDIAEVCNSDIKYNDDGIMYVSIADNHPLIGKHFGFCEKIPRDFVQITFREGQERLNSINAHLKLNHTGTNASIASIVHNDVLISYKGFLKMISDLKSDNMFNYMLNDLYRCGTGTL